MNYKSKMLSLKRSVILTVLAGVSLAFMAGCKTPKSQAPQYQSPPPVKTVSPAPMVEATKPNLPAQPSAPPDSTDSMEPNILAWDSVSKEYRARAGDLSAPFSFSLTNVSARPVVIYDTKTSCDCTVAKLPSAPWTIPSGGSGRIEASINLSNKVGVVTNYVIVFTSQGNRRLNVKAILPEAK